LAWESPFSLRSVVSLLFFSIFNETKRNKYRRGFGVFQREKERSGVAQTTIQKPGTARKKEREKKRLKGMG
jgi:hypothetical protein